jgi:hypothetical protein
MTSRRILVLAMASATAFAQPAARPRAGKPPILRSAEVKAGMKATAWTVFSGSEPEPVPIEILGVLKNAWGPQQDIILGKMGGRAQHTNVAGGMSGSPVYVDGKLMGAVALRLSVFSPDAICGITPIELMLEINDFDQSRPGDAKAPGDSARGAQASAGWTLTPIESPLVMSGFSEATLREFGPMFQQLGIRPAQGGAATGAASGKLAAGWQGALQPGDAVSGVLVSGDMGMTAMGTVTYNDGRRVLAFGHPFLNLGPVSMPMAKADVVMTLASAFQPNKIGNATDVVGALRQDRHSGILGVLGETAEMIPTRLRVRTFGQGAQPIKEKDLRFGVFVQQKWTPFLMMVTLFNSLQGLNDFADEATYRVSGNVEVEGGGRISLSNVFAQGEMPTAAPPPMQMALWWGDKFNRLYLNTVRMPKLRSVDATVELFPRRSVATIEGAFADAGEVEAGAELPVRVYLRPYRGGRIERLVRVKVPASFPRGEHRILFSDAATLNSLQNLASQANRNMDLPQTMSLINQERTNNRLYVSLVQARPTVLVEDKVLPGLPPSVANVMQNGRTGARNLPTVPETAVEQQSIPFDVMVGGSHSLRIKVN